MTNDKRSILNVISYFLYYKSNLLVLKVMKKFSCFLIVSCCLQIKYIDAKLYLPCNYIFTKK